MGDLVDWMPTLASKLGEITGLTGANAGGVRYYADMPHALMEFPIGLLTTIDGAVGPSASQGTIDLTQLQFTVFMPQPFLPETHSVLIPYIALVRNKLAANVTLGGLVSRVGPSSEAKFWSGPGAVRYADKEHGGIIFRLEVKHRTTITVTA